MKRVGPIAFAFVLLASMPIAVHAQAWSGIISSSRATDWSQAGLPGDVPPDASWAQCGATIASYGSSTSPASPSTIQNAINSCGSDQYVLLGPGQFYISGPISLKSNMVLRGSGPNSTFLHFPNANYNSCNGLGGNICLNGSNTYHSGPGTYTEANWTAGYSQAATTITLSTVSGIVTNLTPIVLDACDSGLSGTTGSPTCTGTPLDNGGLYVCEWGGICNTGAASNAQRPLRGQEEVVTATAISGTGPYTVTISPPLRNPNWAALSTPQAWWGSATITNAGVEDLFIDSRTSGNSSIVVTTFYKCWVVGVASDYSTNYHVFGFLGSRLLVRDSYFYWTLNNSTQSYGIGGITQSDSLFENNIMQGVADPVNFDSSCAGCVYAYNYSVNNYFNNTSYLFGLSSYHGAGQSYILAEGNIGSYADSDDVHGSHFLNTMFRNYWNGYQANNGNDPSSNTSASNITAYSRYLNLVGNVLGTSGFHTNYQCAPAASSTFSCTVGWGTSIYSFGWSGNTQDLTDVDTPPAPNDILALSTAMRWGNYDSVTGAVRWCGSSSDTGWSAVCDSASEIPSTLKQRTGFIQTLSGSGAGPYTGTLSNTPCVNGQNFVFENGPNNGIVGYDNGLGSFLSATGSPLTISTSSINCATGAVSVIFAAGTTAAVTIQYVQQTGSIDPYANSVPTVGDTGAGQSPLPSSFYDGVTASQASCGTGLSFWKNPTTGTCPPYPVIGPDVSGGDVGMCTSGPYKWSRALSSSQCAGGTFAVNDDGGHANANPAMLCYLNQMSGPPDGTGAMLTFNPTACYAADGGSGSGSQPPASPSGLTSVAH